MEKRILSLVALVLVMVQGFAVPVDSVKNQSSEMRLSSQSENKLVAASPKTQIGDSQSQDVVVIMTAPDGEKQGGVIEEQKKVTLYVVEAPAADVDEKMDEMLMDVRIFAEDQTIIIESPVQQTAVINDLFGRGKSVRLQVGRNEIPVNSSGVHVVRVGNKSVKLMLR
jgi:hypothetical protein